MLGLAFAIVILILAFGSVLAMGLPVGVALARHRHRQHRSSRCSTNVITMPDFATFLGVMIGLGVGIDYALFIVTRYREQLHAGHTVREAVTIAIDTAGRAVVFAGATVVISLLGMLLMGVDIRARPGRSGRPPWSRSPCVASLTLLPALLGFAGERVEVTRWRGLIAAGLVAIALVGVGLKVQPLVVGLPLGRVVVVAGLLRVGPAAARGAPPPRQARAERRRLPLEPGDPAPPVAAAVASVTVLCSCWPSRCCACASGSPTRATTPADTTTRRPTTCWPTASAPASTAR